MLVQHSYEDSHLVSLREAHVLQIKPNNTCRKYKETAHMACVVCPVSQLSLDVTPIWMPHHYEEVSKLRVVQFRIL